MKGKILGADGGGGTISAEDGKRYKFDLDQWKSQRVPQPGDEVDFDVTGDGRARDVFALRSSTTIDFGAVGDQAKVLLSEGTSSPLGARLIELVTGDLLFQISLVILAASFFLTFIKLTVPLLSNATDALPDRGIYKIVNANDLIDYIKTSLDTVAGFVSQAAQAAAASPGDAGPANFVNSAVGNSNAALAKLHAAAAAMNLFYLIYLIPVGAAAIVVQLARRKPTGLLPLGTGVLAVVAFIGMLIWRGLITKYFSAAVDDALASDAGRMIGIGLGAWVILFCGLGLLGVTLGLIRSPRRG